MKRSERGRRTDEPRPPARRRRARRELSTDEAEYRLFAVAAGIAVAVLVTMVATLVMQLP
jgi:hypothetical protein